LLGDHPAVRGIRRAGLLLAVELGSSEPLYRIMELFKEAGIMSDWFLYCDTAFRISPPLTISDAEAVLPFTSTTMGTSGSTGFDSVA